MIGLDSLPSMVRLQIVGSSELQVSRGDDLYISCKVERSACASRGTDNDRALYSWSVREVTSSVPGFESPALVQGRDPRVVTVPALSLGFAGSTYLFRLNVTIGALETSADATGPQFHASLIALRKV